MRAAIFSHGDFVVDSIAEPKLIEGQVLVKTLCCGICGTDLHAAKFTEQFVERSNRVGGRWPMDPGRDVVFGHEFCCEVVDYGAGAEKRLKPGTLVCSMPMTLSGTTVQGIGYSNEIAGGFAQYMPLAERLLLEVPNGTSKSSAFELMKLLPLITPLITLLAIVGLTLVSMIANLSKRVFPIRVHFVRSPP